MKEVVVITGGAGSGGSYLAEYIVKNHPEAEVHVLVRWHSTTKINNLLGILDEIVVHECDLLDLSTIIRIFRDIKPTKIFNLASHANVRVCFDDPIAVFHNNVMLMANLMEAVRLECPEVVFQQCSTSEVYGNPEIFIMTEKHLLAPVNPYAVSKLAQECLGHAYHKSWGMKIVTTRMFAYINPRRRDLFATSFAYQIAEIEAGKRKILTHGNLASVRTLIDVRDAMRSYWVASNRCKYGEPYNIGGRAILSVGEFLNMLVRHAKVPIRCELDKNLLRPVDVTNQVCDMTKFDEIAKWNPKYTLDDSIEFLLDHCRKEVNA